MVFVIYVLMTPTPLQEEAAFTQGIEEDVKWLGFDWQDNLFYASDYFEKLYGYAMHLIEQGLAYVDDQDAETIRATRGTLKQPGTDSPYRNRSIEDNKALFEKMRAGEFKDGECCLRAKVDMQAGNINLRDPVIYRIRHTGHHRSAINGAFIRYMISLTLYPMPLKVLHTRFVL